MRNATADKIYHLSSTKGDIVISNKEYDLSSISPSSQEEGDTRLQLQYTVNRMLPIIDTLLLTFGLQTQMWLFLACHFFPNTSLQELWIGFGPGKHHKDIPIHNVCEGLGAQRCETLPFLHAFTGSDITSFPHNVGKKTAFKVCELHPELTDTFIKL